VSSLLTPPARSIDPRGQRFGAGVSAVVLAISFALDLPWLAVLVGLDLAIAAAFGTRWFLPGRPWPAIRGILRLGRVEPEHEYPPRFAQALGATAIGLGTVAFAAGSVPVGWLPVGVVAALQAVLATTGVCVGCRLYFLRWWVPSLFARTVGRSRGLPRPDYPTLRSPEA
jgi:hypothetical protein